MVSIVNPDHTLIASIICIALSLPETQSAGIFNSWEFNGTLWLYMPRNLSGLHLDSSEKNLSIFSSFSVLLKFVPEMSKYSRFER